VYWKSPLQEREGERGWGGSSPFCCLNYIATYLNLAGHLLCNPLPNFYEISVELDETQFTSSFDELIRLSYQFLQQSNMG